MVAGAVDGLDLGDNTKALLLTRGLSEMARYGATLGADVLTFGGMAGIGDLMATCAAITGVPLPPGASSPEGTLAGGFSARDSCR